MGLTVQAAANDLLSKLGIEGTDPTQASALVQQDVIIAINWAGQMLQRAGQDYFTRNRLTINLVDGQQEYTISAGTAAFAIQAVLGPLRLNNQVPLAALLSRGELDEFDRIFLGAADYGAAQGVPIAYWPEFLYNGDSTGNIEELNIWFAPIPATNPGFVVAEVVNGWSNFAVANIGSTAELPVAMDYTESIFLPLARLAITRSSQFSRPDILDGITSDAQRAFEQLASAGGFPNVDQNPPERKVSG
jgi:hypothetical protein